MKFKVINDLWTRVKPLLYLDSGSEKRRSDCNDGLDYFNTQNFISIYIALLETKINRYYIFHNCVVVIAALVSKKQPS